MPAAFRDFCLNANEQLKNFVNASELKDAPAVFEMLIGAGEKVHAETQKTGRNFDQYGEKQFLSDQELFESRAKVRPLCRRVQKELPWRLNEELENHKGPNAAGVTLNTVGCSATKRLGQFAEACIWYDSRAANKLEWPSEADERAALKVERAGFEEFCLKARFNVENFLSESPWDTLDETIKAMQEGIMIGRKVRDITKSTGRNVGEIQANEVAWYIRGPRFPSLCMEFGRDQPSLYRRLSEALEEQKAALQAAGQSGDSLANITLENVGCAATYGLFLFQGGCHWWHNRPNDRLIVDTPNRETSKSRRVQPKKKEGEDDWYPMFVLLAWAAAGYLVACLQLLTLDKINASS